jgi:hypothetical protein
MDASDRAEPSRFGPALVAGTIAIGVNTALLSAAGAVGFVTARGGLLRLIENTGAGVATALGQASLWNDVVSRTASGPHFQNAFHVCVGLLMALFYAYAVEPLLTGAAWRKGLVYAAAIWLLNAFGVLPLIGQGIAGSRSLGIAGMVGFACIHTVFFVLLAVLYPSLRIQSAVTPAPS